MFVRVYTVHINNNTQYIGFIYRVCWAGGGRLQDDGWGWTGRGRWFEFEWQESSSPRTPESSSAPSEPSPENRKRVKHVMCCWAAQDEAWVVTPLPVLRPQAFSRGRFSSARSSSSRPSLALLSQQPRCLYRSLCALCRRPSDEGSASFRGSALGVWCSPWRWRRVCHSRRAMSSASSPPTAPTSGRSFRRRWASVRRLTTPAAPVPPSLGAPRWPALECQWWTGGDRPHSLCTESACRGDRESVLSVSVSHVISLK